MAKLLILSITSLIFMACTQLDPSVGPTFTDSRVDPSVGPTFTDSRGHEFTWIGNPPIARVNGIPIVTLNGVDQGAIGSDSDYWTTGDGEQDGPFTILIWAKSDPGTATVFGPQGKSGTLIAKYQIGSIDKDTGIYWQEYREWLLQFETPANFIGVIRDEETNGGIKARATGYDNTQWTLWGLTYDGSGYGGATVWRNGKPVTSSVTNYSNYLAVHNTKTPVMLGMMIHNGKYFDFWPGKIAGGRCGPLFAKSVLTASEQRMAYAACSDFLVN